LREGAEGYSEFEPSERGTDAVVDSAAEGAVWVRIPSEVEALWISEQVRVAVRRRNYQDDDSASRDVDSADLDRCMPYPCRDLDGPVEAEDLLDRRHRGVVNRSEMV
jgi:hypothetical protein